MKIHAALVLTSLLMGAESNAAGSSPWVLPETTSAAQPSLSQAPDGGLNLSWVERTSDGHRLRFSRFRKSRWSAPVTVAAGSNWFVNWADFPSTTQLSDGTLWAHNLVKSAAGTYAYNVVLYKSRDNGATWSKPVLVNDDNTETEHGFATLWPWSKSELALAWLDGRETAGTPAHDHRHHEQTKDDGNAMTLRAAVFGAGGNRVNEWKLDARTCDCCQTDSAVTPAGPLVVYRDRSENEIRDIYVTRFSNGHWQKPKRVARDNWLMPACPVNGPAIAANGHSVWAAWYTAANNNPAIRVAYSGDSGNDFKLAKTFKNGKEVQGRVDLSADAEGAWMLWLEEADNQTLWLARLDKQLNTVGAPIRIAQLQGRGRATGFARMQAVGKSVYVVWTDTVNGKPKLQGAQFRF